MTPRRGAHRVLEPVAARRCGARARPRGDRQYVREAFYDCDGDTLLFVVEQEGKGACHTGECSCFYRALRRLTAWSSSASGRPGRSSAPWPREHTVVPVWRELLADLITPVAAFARLVGDEPGFLLESVEHGERWSRWSFVGRDAGGHARRCAAGGVEVDGRAARRRAARPGHPGRLDALLAAYRAPPLPDLPPLHGGVVGYLGYDVVREVERLPDVPPDDQGLPDAVHERHRRAGRLRPLAPAGHLIENVPVLGLRPAPSLDAALRRRRRAAWRQLAADGARPLDEPLVEPPDPDEALPDGALDDAGSALYQQAVEVAKEHILAGDIFQVVLAQRFDLELDADPFDVYRVLRQVNPSPYMYFLRHPEVTIVGLVARADGAAARRAR